MHQQTYKNYSVVFLHLKKLKVEYSALKFILIRNTQYNTELNFHFQRKFLIFFPLDKEQIIKTIINLIDLDRDPQRQQGKTVRMYIPQIPAFWNIFSIYPVSDICLFLNRFLSNWENSKWIFSRLFLQIITLCMVCFDHIWSQWKKIYTHLDSSSTISIFLFNMVCRILQVKYSFCYMIFVFAAWLIQCKKR